MFARALADSGKMVKRKRNEFDNNDGKRRHGARSYFSLDRNDGGGRYDLRPIRRRWRRSQSQANRKRSSAAVAMKTLRTKQTAMLNKRGHNPSTPRNDGDRFTGASAMKSDEPFPTASQSTSAQYKSARFYGSAKRVRWHGDSPLSRDDAGTMTGERSIEVAPVGGTEKTAPKVSKHVLLDVGSAISTRLQKWERILENFERAVKKLVRATQTMEFVATNITSNTSGRVNDPETVNENPHQGNGDEGNGQEDVSPVLNFHQSSIHEDSEPSLEDENAQQTLVSTDVWMPSSPV